MMSGADDFLEEMRKAFESVTVRFGSAVFVDFDGTVTRMERDPETGEVLRTITYRGDDIISVVDHPRQNVRI